MTYGEPNSEPAADVWVQAEVPEAGLHYADVHYRNTETGRMVTAKDIETVSEAFAKKVVP
jgi:hypothetical protein